MIRLNEFEFIRIKKLTVYTNLYKKKIIAI